MKEDSQCVTSDKVTEARATFASRANVKISRRRRDILTFWTLTNRLLIDLSGCVRHIDDYAEVVTNSKKGLSTIHLLEMLCKIPFGILEETPAER